MFTWGNKATPSNVLPFDLSLKVKVMESNFFTIPPSEFDFFGKKATKNKISREINP